MTQVSIEVASGTFEVDPVFGVACEAYQLQLPVGGMPGLLELQRTLFSTGREAFHVIPQASLHVTVLPLIDAVEELRRPKRDLWTEFGAGWRAAILEACSRTSPIALRFTRILYARRAVIAVADGDPASQLRQAIAPSCSLPERALRVPAITHVTLARYRLADRVEVARPDGLRPVQGVVRRLRLIRESRYPSLDHDLLDEFQLG